MTDEPKDEPETIELFGMKFKPLPMACMTCGIVKMTATMRFRRGYMIGPYCDECAKEADVKDEMDKYRRLD